MTQLALEGFVGDWHAATGSELDAAVEGQRIALVGDWQFLFDVLCGRANSAAGQLLIDGSDARGAVIEGRVGVADPQLPGLPGNTVAQWIEAHCRLHGLAPKQAGERASATLERLGLSYLGRYRLESLPDETLYAARAALGAATQPQTLVLPSPAWTEQSRQFDQTLLESLNQHAGLVLWCDPTRQPELFLTCDVAVVRGAAELLIEKPNQLWTADGSHYAVVALSDPATLAKLLTERGAQVTQAGAMGELWVRLPDGVDSGLLVQSALDSGTPLQSVYPLLNRF